MKSTYLISQSYDMRFIKSDSQSRIAVLKFYGHRIISFCILSKRQRRKLVKHIGGIIPFPPLSSLPLCLPFSPLTSIATNLLTYRCSYLIFSRPTFLALNKPLWITTFDTCELCFSRRREEQVGCCRSPFLKCYFAVGPVSFSSLTLAALFTHPSIQ